MNRRRLASNKRRAQLSLCPAATRVRRAPLEHLFTGTMSEQQFEILKILLDKGLLAIIGILLGYWVSRKLEQFKYTQEARVREMEAARQDALRVEEQRRQEQLSDEERRLVPRTEFDAHCEFFGPEPDGYPAMITLSIHNKGLTQRSLSKHASAASGNS